MRRNNIWPSSAKPSVPVRPTTTLRTMSPRRNHGFPMPTATRGLGPTPPVGGLPIRKRCAARQHPVHRVGATGARMHHLIHLNGDIVVHIDFAVHIGRIRPPDRYLHAR